MTTQANFHVTGKNYEALRVAAHEHADALLGQDGPSYELDMDIHVQVRSLGEQFPALWEARCVLRLFP